MTVMAKDKPARGATGGPRAPNAALADLLHEYQCADAAAIATRDALYAIVDVASAPLGEDECADFWGDGRAKRRAGCTLPGGMVPPRMIPRRPVDPGARRAARAEDRRAMASRLPPTANAADRRHNDAMVPPGLMRVAEARRTANKQAWEDRAAAAQALNLELARQMRPAGVPMREGYVVDVFGDGATKPIAQATFPAEVQTWKVRGR